MTTFRCEWRRVPCRSGDRGREPLAASRHGTLQRHIGAMQNTRLLMLDHDLGPEIDLLRHSVRDFAEAKIAPIAAEIDKSDRFPVELWPELGALGPHGLTVDEGYCDSMG